MKHPPKTHGQQLLRQIPTRQDEIAAKIGFSQPQISRWRAGSRKPSAAARAALEQHLGIPSGAWDRMPVADGSMPAGISAPTPPQPPAPAGIALQPSAPTANPTANPAPPAPPQPPAGYEPPATAQIAAAEPFEPPDYSHHGTAAAELRESCGRLRAAIDRAVNPAPGIPPPDPASVAKLERQYGAMLVALARAQGELTVAEEARLSATPTFHRFKDGLIEGLRSSLEQHLPGDDNKSLRNSIIRGMAAAIREQPR